MVWGGGLEVVWRLSGGCQEGVWRMSGGCGETLDSVGSLSGGYDESV